MQRTRLGPTQQLANCCRVRLAQKKRGDPAARPPTQAAAHRSQPSPLASRQARRQRAACPPKIPTLPTSWSHSRQVYRPGQHSLSLPALLPQHNSTHHRPNNKLAATTSQQHHPLRPALLLDWPSPDSPAQHSPENTHRRDHTAQHEGYVQGALAPRDGAADGELAPSRCWAHPPRAPRPLSAHSTPTTNFAGRRVPISITRSHADASLLSRT